MAPFFDQEPGFRVNCAGNLDKWHGLCQPFEEAKEGWFPIGLRLRRTLPLVVTYCSGRGMSTTFERVIRPQEGRQPIDFIETYLYCVILDFLAWNEHRSRSIQRWR